LSVQYGSYYGQYMGQDGCTGQGSIEKLYFVAINKYKT